MVFRNVEDEKVISVLYSPTVAGEFLRGLGIACAVCYRVLLVVQKAQCWHLCVVSTVAAICGSCCCFCCCCGSSSGLRAIISSSSRTGVFMFVLFAPFLLLPFH